MMERLVGRQKGQLVPAQPDPDGREHQFGIDELFFSTTDRRGVIEQANSVFVRLSHYPHSELVGAPHNVIRHPGMPGGAFKLVWDAIQAGKPACAYVKNLAADGGAYWVFATIVPVGDKYLSVRMKPSVTALKEASAQLYSRVREAERNAMQHGIPAPVAADQGATQLLTGLAQLGLTGFDDLAMTALPAEMAEHERLSAGLPQRPGATGVLAELLSTMHLIDGETRELVRNLDPYDELTEQLDLACQQADPTIDRLAELVATARRISLDAQAPGPAPDGPEAERTALAPTPADLVDAMADRATRATALLTEQRQALHDLKLAVRSMRLQISIMRLHNVMVGRFAAELIDGDSTGDAAVSIQILCSALQDGAHAMVKELADTKAAADLIPEQVMGAVQQVDRFRRRLSKWRGAVLDGGLPAPELQAIEAQLAMGFGELDQLSALAARCKYLSVPFEPDRFDEILAQMRSAAGQMSLS